MSPEQVAVVVLGDVALVVAVSALGGRLALRCGQPAVVGQIVGGLLLGPTALGRLPGDLDQLLFPAEVRPFLAVLAQVAVVVFMFVIGYELDERVLRGAGRAPALVAAAALAVPMGLGALLALGAPGLLTAVGQVGGRDGAGGSFVLFMGVACAVTALPVLAAIVRERGLAGTPAGTVATTAAGFMDAAAWLVLAAALAGTGAAGHLGWPATALLTGVLVAVLLLVVRPVLTRLLDHPGRALAGPLPIALVLALGCGWATGTLGLHAIVGGFLAGLVMPRRDGAPDPDVLRPMEQTAGLLLPLFFVTTGMSVDLGALTGPAVLLLGVVLLIAVVGEVVPAYLAARVAGLDPHQARVVAALVNTRGLTELIALNAGLAAGLVDRPLFGVLVLMALITTAMTAPLLALADRRRPSPPGDPGNAGTSGDAGVPVPAPEEAHR